MRPLNFVIVASILITLFGCRKKKEEETDTIELNLRVHLMQDDAWVHSTGVSMSSWVSKTDFEQTILPEVNVIWGPAQITWKIESIIEEQVIKSDTYDTDKDAIMNSERDQDGKSDPTRLVYLYAMMNPDNRSTTEELSTNLFHVYLFPVLGNTSQGNAMAKNGFHTVVGTWSNKHTTTDSPEKMLLTEDPSDFDRGSLGATIAHEEGHVLGLTHDQCKKCLMHSDGYSLTDEQVSIARTRAGERSQ